MFKLKLLPLRAQSGFSAVGSALRSGRRGRKFESCNPDKTKWSLPLGKLYFIFTTGLQELALGTTEGNKMSCEPHRGEQLYFVLAACPRQWSKITERSEVIL